LKNGEKDDDRRTMNKRILKHKGLEAKPLYLWLGAFLFKLSLIAIFILPNYSRWEGRFSNPIDHRIANYDDGEYLAISKGIVDYGMFSFAEGKAEPQIFRTPAYPFFLMLLGVLSNWNVLIMLLLQAAVFSLIPILFLANLRVLKLPLWISWLMALDPFMNIVSISFMTEGLLILFVLLSVYFLFRSSRFTSILLAFLFWSIAILVKPSIQYFSVIVVLVAALRTKKWKSVAVGTLIAAMPLFLWAARNHHVSRQWKLSTQTDNSIMAIITVEALEKGRPIDSLIADYNRRLPKGLYPTIMDNQIDFNDEVREFIIDNPILFVKYHIKGMVRLMFGTGQVHFAYTILASDKKTFLSSSFNRAYTLVMLFYYSIVYLVVIVSFKMKPLKDSAGLFIFSFILYNLTAIGIFAYTTGGALKRIVFYPFILLLLGLFKNKTQANLS
jgi:hypothetical protein